MSDPEIVPRVPFIPDQPPAVVERRIVEWENRADLAVNAYDGQWRVLCSYPQFNCDLWERWYERDSYLWLAHWLKKR